MIKIFRGEYEFLSNFYECEVPYKGICYRNSEAAFQAQKVHDLNIQMTFATYTGSQAKYHGKRVTLREDWNLVKDEIMYEVVLSKFNHNPLLKEKLLNTSREELVEGNIWHDKYWGVDLKTGIGENRLGKILMKVRQQLS